jgi:histidine triad (HIT) family protein
LIIPKAHCDDIFGVSPADLRAIVDRSRELAHAIRGVLAPDGLGVFQLNGAAAGQTVFHYHMHLIPRSHGASLAIHSRTPGDPERMAKIANQLGEALGRGSGALR